MIFSLTRDLRENLISVQIFGPSPKLKFQLGVKLSASVLSFETNLLEMVAPPDRIKFVSRLTS